MVQTTNKYQIIQKISADDTVLLHPETDADVVEYSDTKSGLGATTVQGAIEKLAEGTGVTAVKGNAESTYRKGQVNLTPADIGAEELGSIETHNKSGTAHSDIRNAVSTAQSRADDAYALAEGKANATSYTSIEAFITAFNSLAKNSYKVGDNIYLQTLNVPDLWVYSIESSSSAYTYTSDDAFINALKSAGSVQ
ncbi:MAG: hypothetical protein IJ371_04215, partial [Clostridia bacterium]|nr:hypothetical protein [Clostridia bacterium]